MPNNVLLIVLDALRADHTSVHGYDRKTTPFLEELAEDGVYFDRTFAAAPWTPPSHASIFSGVYPTSHGYLTSRMPFDPSHSPLAELLREAGYSTFGAVRNGHIDSRQAVSRGFEEFCDIYRLPRIPESFPELKAEYLDLWRGYANVALRSLGTNRRVSEYVTYEYVKRRILDCEAPFFGFININSPHTPYAPPEPFRSQFETFDRNEVDMDVVRSLAHVDGKGGHRFVAGEIDPSPEEWDAAHDWYDGAIRFADFLVERLIRTLRRVGSYDETTIIVTADHGEHFGEHDRSTHQFSLFDELLHVPLVIKPAKSQPTLDSTDALVSLVDLYPTILDGLDMDVPPTVQGESLFQQVSRDTVFAEYGEPKSQLKNLESSLEGPLDPEIRRRLDTPLQCARTRELKYVRAPFAEDRAFEITDGSPKDREIPLERCADLREEIQRTLGDDLSTSLEEEEIDETRRENLRDLGYI
jgi:arylsulfatase A-like enzyme